MIAAPVVEFKDVSKTYDLKLDSKNLHSALKSLLGGEEEDASGKMFYALRDVTFSIRSGQTVGIIGQNGAGKSTVLKIIAGITSATKGTVKVKGRISSLIELGAGFHPDLTGRENIFMNGSVLGLPRKLLKDRFDDIVDFAELWNFIDVPIRKYSSGMYARLGFAVAINVEPDILIVDEALAVGDLLFQSRCFQKINEMKERGTTIIFVTHNMTSFLSICTEGILMDLGKIVMQGEPSNVAQAYYQLIREHEHKFMIKKEHQTLLPEQSLPGQPVLTYHEPKRSEKNRFGLYTAEIVGYRVLNHENVESTQLTCGLPFRIELRIFFHGRVVCPAVGAMFRNVQGQNLFGVHSYHGAKINFGMRESGDVLEVQFEEYMMLNPGEYVLYLGIADQETDHVYKSLDEWDRIAEIRVVGDAVRWGMLYTSPKVTYRIMKHSE